MTVRVGPQNDYRIRGVALSEYGTPVRNAPYTVTDLVAGGAATIYTDRTLATPIVSPKTTSEGIYEFWVPPSIYRVNLTGERVQQPEDVTVGDDVVWGSASSVATVSAQLATEALSRATGDTTWTRFIKTASYTIVAGDEAKWFDMNAAAGPLVFTVDGAVNLAQGTKLQVTQYGSFPVTIAFTNGATVVPATAPLTSVNQGDTFILHKRTSGAGEWMISYVPAPGTLVAQSQVYTAGAEKIVLSLQTSESGKGAWEYEVSDYPSGTGGRFDATLRSGYNPRGAVTAEPRWYWTLENNYEPGGARWQEGYLEWVKGSGRPGAASIRPFFIVIDEHAGHTLRWAICSDVGVEFDTDDFSLTYANITPTAATLRNNAGAYVLTLGAATNASHVTLDTLAGAVHPLTIVGVSDTAPPTADFQSQAEAVFKISNDVTTTPHRHVMDMFGKININLANVPDNVAGWYAAGIDMIQRATPTNPLIAISDSAGNLPLWWELTKNGYMSIGKNSAPADAEVRTSQMVLWFDNTNGAGKLMVKAKTANGTVVTGSLALA